MDIKNCIVCKKDQGVINFMSPKGKEFKICIRCRNRNNKKCVHDKLKRECRGYGNSRKMIILNMLKTSKQADIKKNRYDANNFVDKCFLEMLMDESMECYYCKIEMQLIEYSDTLCTIERLDNKIGHTKANCVLACKKCNITKK